MNLQTIIGFLISFNNVLQQATPPQKKLSALQVKYQELLSNLNTEQIFFLTKILNFLIMTNPLKQATFLTLLNIEADNQAYTFYNAITDFTKLAHTMDNAGCSCQQAKTLSTLCENFQDVLLYLQIFSKQYKPEHLLNDACDFRLPEGNITWIAWRALANHNGKWGNLIDSKEFQETILPIADQIEDTLRALASHEYTQWIQEKKAEIEFPFILIQEIAKPLRNELEQLWYLFVINLNQNNTIYFKEFLLHCPFSLLEQYKSLCYRKGQRNINAAIEFHKHGISQEIFDQYCTLEPRESELIPSVMITGAHIGFPKCKYYLKKIDSRDPRAACLGKYTDCCQTLGDKHGGACTWYGIVKRYSGFYCLFRGNPNAPKTTDTIVAQCWAWRNDTHALALDSMEYLSQTANGPKTANGFNNLDIYIALYRALAEHLVSEPKYGISKVIIGNVGKTPKGMALNCNALQHWQAENPIQFEDYYRDTQVISCGQLLEMQSVLASSYMPLSALYTLATPYDFPGTEGKQIKENAELTLRAYFRHASESDIALLIQGCCATSSYLNFLVLRILYYHIPKAYQQPMHAFIHDKFQEKTYYHIEEIIKYGSLEDLEWILQHGAMANQLYSDTLLKAAYAKKWQIVICLIEHGTHVNAKSEPNNESASLLHLFVQNNDLDMVNLLLKKGIYINKVDKDQRTALHIAIEAQLWEIVKLLLDAGANINIQDKNQCTILHILAHKDLWEQIQYCVERSRVDVDINLQNNEEQTLFSLAAKAGQFNLLKILSYKQPSLNTANTALKQAAYKNHWDIVHYLVKMGADVKFKIFLSLDFEGCSLETFQFLFEKLKHQEYSTTNIQYSGYQLLLKAANAQKWDIVNYLIEKKIPIKSKERDTRGRTILHLMAIAGETASVPFILSNYSNLLNCKDHYDYTALSLAILHKHWDLVHYLLQQPTIDLKSTDGSDRTVLHLAAEAKAWDIVKLLVERGADLEASSYYGTVSQMAENDKQLDYVLGKSMPTLILSTQSTSEVDDNTKQNTACMHSREKTLSAEEPKATLSC